jgi:sec-independent protein translocase protein TatB
MFPENRFMEVLIIGALALIVIGPKDLPMLMRRIGQFVGKMRGMAAEFRASFDELARQSELDELRREVESLRAGASLTGDAADPHAAGVFDEIKSNLSLQMTPAMTPLPQPELIAASPTPEPAAPPEAKPARKPRAKVAAKPNGAKPAASKPAAAKKTEPKPAARKAATRATGPAS